MTILYFVPLMIFALVATMAWAISTYVDVRHQWHAQRELQPRCRPVLSRPVVAATARPTIHRVR